MLEWICLLGRYKYVQFEGTGTCYAFCFGRKYKYKIFDPETMKKGEFCCEDKHCKLKYGQIKNTTLTGSVFHYYHKFMHNTRPKQYNEDYL